MTADIKETIANEAIRIVTGARRAAYGKPEQNFARIALFWVAYFENLGVEMTIEEGGGPSPFLIEAKHIPPMMRLMKEARLCESPDHLDSFVDLVGYALCGAEVAGVDGLPITGKAEQIAAAIKAQTEFSSADLGELFPKVMAEHAPVPFEPEQPAKLQIEAGKFYRTRGGEVVGPMLAYGDDEFFCVTKDGLPNFMRLWHSNGERFCRAEAHTDLVEEVPAP